MVIRRNAYTIWGKSVESIAGTLSLTQEQERPSSTATLSAILVTDVDLQTMYSELRQAGKSEVCLWCNRSDCPNQRKHKRDDSPGPISKHAEK